MGLFSFVESLQSKIEESVESLQSKIEDASNNFQNSVANKVQEFADNLKVSNNRATSSSEKRIIIDTPMGKRDVTGWKRDKHGRYVSPSAEYFMDDDDEEVSEPTSNEQEDGWSMDDILALSNSKKAQDLLDSLTDEEKEALGLSKPKMGTMSDDEIDWSNVLRSNSSLAGCDDDDE